MKINHIPYYLCALLLAIFVYNKKNQYFNFNNTDSLFYKIRSGKVSSPDRTSIFYPDMGASELKAPDGKIVWLPKNINTNRDKYDWLESIKIHYDIQNKYIKEDNITVVPSSPNIIDYDFRKVATNLDYLFEQTKAKCEAAYPYGSDIIADKFGCTLANLFLVRQKQSWKDKYIRNVHYIDPYIAGTTKSLAVILSGENVNNIERPFFRTIIRNYSCLLMSLPNPDVFGNQVLVQYDGKEYIAEDIYKLLTLTGATDSAELYKNICLPLQKEAYADPGVYVTYSITDKKKTPIMFKYNDSLLDIPDHIYYSSHQDELHIPAPWKYI